ncbi:MAG: ArnT family glycosyltransferase, partial [Thermoplasmata archaeon]
PEVYLTSLFALAMGVRWAATTSYVYNDEVGGGYTGYGHRAWGYFDTARVYYGSLSHGNLLSVATWSFHAGSLTPLTPLLAAVSMLGLRSLPSLEAARFPVAVLSALTTVVVAVLATQVFQDYRCGVLSGLVFALDPIAVLSGRILYEDAGAVFFGCLALCLLIQSQRKPGGWLWAGSGICLALALSSKDMGLLFSGVVLLGTVRWGTLARWIFRHGPRANLTFLPWKGLGVVFGSMVAVLLLAFPWELPALIVRLDLLAAHTVLYGSHPKLTYFLGRLVPAVPPTVYSSVLVLVSVDPWVLALGLVGLVVSARALRSYYRAATPRIGPNVLLAYAVLTVGLFSVLRPVFSHYLLFLLVPAILFAAKGFWFAADRLGSWLSSRDPGGIAHASGADRKFWRRARRREWARTLVLVGAISLSILPLATNYEYPGLYYSPLVGGLPGAAHLVEIDGNEATGPASSYVQAHFSPGSTVLILGQVHLFAYQLPGYQVLGPNDVHNQYQQAPEAFLHLANVTAVVMEFVAYQTLPQDPMFNFLRAQDPVWEMTYQGLVLVSVYAVALLPAPTIALEETPPFPGWIAHDGTLGANGTLGVGANETYAWASTPDLVIAGGCQSLVAVTVAHVSSTTTAFRVEWAAANGTIVARGYFHLATGLQLRQVSAAVVGILPSIQLRFVIVGPPGSELQLSSVAVGCGP